MLELRDITMENFRKCLALELDEFQKNFVASNCYSLAEAKADGVSVPNAIYHDGVMVGFIMYDYNDTEKIRFISRLMIDKKYQRKGFGSRAMAMVIDELRQKPDIRCIQTSYHPENSGAAVCYERLGFIKTGELHDGEVVCVLGVKSEER